MLIWFYSYILKLAMSATSPRYQGPNPRPKENGDPSPRRNKIHNFHPPITSQDPILRHFRHFLSNGFRMADLNLKFPSLFKACRELSAMEEGKQLHGQAIKGGFHRDVFVQRSLIRMYSKCHSCRDALKVLGRCSSPDIVSQNDLILGFSRSGDLDSAHKIFDGMSERNVVSWSVLIDGYTRVGKMEVAQELFDSMPARNPFSWNSLISGYLRLGCVESAREIFDRVAPELGVVTWTAMISGYVQNSRSQEALNLFLKMQEVGIAPNVITIISVLPAVAQIGALSQGRWIHAYADKMGMEVGSTLGSALVDMYAKCGCIEDAVTIFERLQHKELPAWNSIILGLATHGRGKEALHFFARMRGDFSMTPNNITFVGVLSACSHSGLVDEGWELFDLFTNHYNLTPNSRHYGCMIDLLGRAGLLEEALELMEKMPTKPNSVIWTTLLGACRTHKNTKLADRILQKMTEVGSGPQDGGFYSLVSNIFTEAGLWTDACKVRREMNDLGLQKAAGCSWVEVDGVVCEFLMGKESFHEQSREILCVLYEMERLMKLEIYGGEF